jgi:SAM-dependent methyltransferase
MSIRKFSKNIAPHERYLRAIEYRGHRKDRLGINQSYETHRSLSRVKSEFGVDLVRFLQSRIRRKKKQFRFLDSGAGLLQVSGPLKKKFGSTLHVTAISLTHPNMHPNSIQEFKRRNKHDTFIEQSKLNKLREEKLDAIESAKEYSKKLDEVKVGFVENFESKEKYDLILDLYGPVTHSRNPESIVKKYFEFLEEGGELISLQQNWIGNAFGKESVFARNKGFYFEGKVIGQNSKGLTIVNLKKRNYEVFSLIKYFRRY